MLQSSHLLRIPNRLEIARNLANSLQIATLGVRVIKINYSTLQYHLLKIPKKERKKIHFEECKVHIPHRFLISREEKTTM